MEIKKVTQKVPLTLLVHCDECERPIQMGEETTFCPLCMRELEHQNIRVWTEWGNLPVIEKLKMISDYEKDNPDAYDVFDDERNGVKLESEG